jgi:hypothetical protein
LVQARDDNLADYKAARSTLANLRRVGGADSKRIADLETRMFQSQQMAFHNDNLLDKQSEEKAHKLSATAGAINDDGSNVVGVVNALDRIAPGWSKNADLNRDLMGNPAWGKQTQDAIAQANAAGQTAVAQLQAKTAKNRVAQEAAQLEFQKTEATRKENESVRKDSLARDALEVRSRAETRLENTVKAGKVPEPKEKEVQATADKLRQDNPGLNGVDAKVAAQDYYGKLNDLLRSGTPREDAQAQAQTYVKAKIETIEPGKPLVKSNFFGMGGSPAVPAKVKYNREGVPELAQALDKAGVSYSLTPGEKGVILSDAKTADKGIALLPPGTVYTGPDGIPRVRGGQK